MKVIDKLVDIANNGTSEIIQYFRYYNRNANQFDSCMLSLDNLIYKLNNGALDINDEIKVIDEDTPKEDKKIEKIQLPIPSLSPQLIYLSTKINEIIDRLNGEDNE